MNLPFNNFEETLKRMRPIDPDPILTRRIEAELQTQERTPEYSWRFWRMLKHPNWGLIACSFAVIWILSILCPNIFLKTVSPNTPSRLKNEQSQANSERRSPIQSLKTDNYLVAAQEDGILFSLSSAPLRKVKYRVISSSEWFDDTEKATVQLLSPHEEVVLLPINVH